MFNKEDLEYASYIVLATLYKAHMRFEKATNHEMAMELLETTFFAYLDSARNGWLSKKPKEERTPLFFEMALKGMCGQELE